MTYRNSRMWMASSYRRKGLYTDVWRMVRVVLWVVAMCLFSLYWPQSLGTTIVPVAVTSCPDGIRPSCFELPTVSQDCKALPDNATSCDALPAFAPKCKDLAPLAVSCQQSWDQVAAGYFLVMITLPALYFSFLLKHYRCKTSNLYYRLLMWTNVVNVLWGMVRAAGIQNPDEFTLYDIMMAYNLAVGFFMLALLIYWCVWHCVWVEGWGARAGAAAHGAVYEVVVRGSLCATPDQQTSPGGVSVLIPSRPRRTGVLSWFAG